MPEITHEDLARHLKVLAEASSNEKDELLTDLLVHVYRTKSSQDS
jgi:hypothetical protein